MTLDDGIKCYFMIDRAVSYKNSPAIIDNKQCRLLQINDHQLKRLSFIINEEDIFSEDTLSTSSDILKNDGFGHIVITRNYYPDIKKYDYFVQLTMAKNAGDIHRMLRTMEKPAGTVTCTGWLINPGDTENQSHLLQIAEKLIGICSAPHHLLQFCVEIPS